MSAHGRLTTKKILTDYYITPPSMAPMAAAIACKRVITQVFINNTSFIKSLN